jgi:hypothetical protein
MSLQSDIQLLKSKSKLTPLYSFNILYSFLTKSKCISTQVIFLFNKFAVCPNSNFF